MTRNEDLDLMPLKAVKEFFGGTSRDSIRRWQDNPAIGFPRPVARINQVWFWRAADIRAFSRRAMTTKFLGSEASRLDNFRAREVA
jgi:hypothetical protein